MALTESGRRVRENATSVYQATIVDEDEVAIPANDLDALTLTLYDKGTGTIINSRDGQDVLNANNVTVSAQGVLVWTMQPEDNPIVTPSEVTHGLEAHIALFEWTWDTTKKGNYEVQIDVLQIKEIP